MIIASIRTPREIQLTKIDGHYDHRGDESLFTKVSNDNSVPTQSLHDHVSQADKKLKKTEPNWATQLADFLAQNKAGFICCSRMTLLTGPN